MYHLLNFIPFTIEVFDLNFGKIYIFHKVIDFLDYANFIIQNNNRFE